MHTAEGHLDTSCSSFHYHATRALGTAPNLSNEASLSSTPTATGLPGLDLSSHPTLSSLGTSHVSSHINPTADIAPDTAAPAVELQSTQEPPAPQPQIPFPPPSPATFVKVAHDSQAEAPCELQTSQ